jgi:HAD superfamily hydrolase (TIGR01549 family)
MDGTLTVHTNAFNQAHDALRYQAYSEAVGRPVDDRLVDEYEALYKQHGSNSAVFTSLGKVSDHWMRYYNSVDMTGHYEPDPDVYETVDKLRKLVPLSLFTNNRLEAIEKTLEAVDIETGWFKHIIVGDDVPNRKPALDGYKLVIERTGIPSGNILYVGDRVSADIVPAKAVGMMTCLVYGQSSESDFCFDKFSDLLSLT